MKKNIPLLIKKLFKVIKKGDKNIYTMKTL